MISSLSRVGSPPTYPLLRREGKDPKGIVDRGMVGCAGCPKSTMMDGHEHRTGRRHPACLFRAKIGGTRYLGVYKVSYRPLLSLLHLLSLLSRTDEEELDVLGSFPLQHLKELCNIDCAVYLFSKSVRGARSCALSLLLEKGSRYEDVSGASKDIINMAMTESEPPREATTQAVAVASYRVLKVRVVLWNASSRPGSCINKLLFYP
jgi:hypothetical protein